MMNVCKEQEHTYSVASLSADGSDALDISTSGGHGVIARKL